MRASEVRCATLALAETADYVQRFATKDAVGGDEDEEDEDEDEMSEVSSASGDEGNVRALAVRRADGRSSPLRWSCDRAHAHDSMYICHDTTQPASIVCHPRPGHVASSRAVSAMYCFALIVQYSV